MTPLSPKMHEALVALSRQPDGRASAYGLRVSMATMEGLHNRRLIKRHCISGWMFSPRTCSWQITDAGREIVAKAEGNA